MNQGKEKECFGILDRVFPRGSEGLREIPPHCFDCEERVPCLRSAVSTEEGIRMREEILDRQPVTGFTGMLRRWSRKKALSRLEGQEREKRR